MSNASSHRAAPTTPAEKRRRWVTWLIAFVALLFVVAITWSIIDAMGRAALKQQIDKIRASGAPVTIAELEATLPDVPDDRNAVVILGEMNTKLGPLERELTRSRWLPFAGFAGLPPPGDPIDVRIMVAIDRALPQVQDALQTIDRAAELDTSRPVSLHSDLRVYNADVGPLVLASGIKSLQIIKHNSEGDAEAAAHGICQLLALSDAWSDMPFLYSYNSQILSNARAVALTELALASGQ